MGVRRMPTTEVTGLYKFGIDGGRIRYIAAGEVEGHLLNQFSMDEYGGNLRVATTVEGYGSSGSYQYNNVFVLDPGMKTIGSLKYIAPDEKIYSTRFIGDRLYMVTFKRIDPLFVIDLSDPKNPGILGKLKIPGYSHSLPPYASDHIIGIGKETELNDWGGVSTSGLKLALFDVEVGPQGIDYRQVRHGLTVMQTFALEVVVLSVGKHRPQL